MNWALIGYGGMGHWHVDKVLSMPERFKVAGIYDIDPERQKEAAEKGFHAYATLQELLDDKGVDFVTLAVPNDFHRPLAIECMAHGKHVISEKPVTLSVDDLYQMINAARENKRVFSVHQNRRWDEDFLTVKKLYDTNELGRVFNIESRVHGSRGVPGDWRNQYVHGGGMILDWGIHLVDQMLQLVPEDVISVWCKTTHITNFEIDDGFTVVLTFASGLTATVEVGTSNFISLPRWYVQGQNGTAILNDFGCHGEIVKVCDWEKKDAVPVVTAAGLTKTMAPRTDETIKRYPLPKVTSDVRDYYRNFADAIEGKATQLVTHEQMIRVMKVMEAMFLSADRNEVIHSRI